MFSLTARLLIALTLVLGSFLGLTGYVLDQAYQRSAKVAVEERLQGHVMTLVASAQVRLNGTIFIPEILPNVRFNQVNSGLYGTIVNNKGELLWRSSSLGETKLPLVTLKENTETRFRLIEDTQGMQLFNYSYGVSWDTINKAHVFTINVSESLEAYTFEIERFRQLLWMWLGGVSLVLLAVQGVILSWSLHPLRRAADEISYIEQGRQETIEGNYPRELRGLTKNLNALMQSNKEHLQRHRNALSDLAHSLKTPLALMRSSSESKNPLASLQKTVEEQVSQMQNIVDYQLQRAATSGHIPLSKPVKVGPVVNKMMNSLAKVYAEKPVGFNIHIKKNTLFYGDESDLYELLGNVLDNAFKWCEHKVKISVVEKTIDSNKINLTIEIEDDGPGIDQTIADKVLERGVRSNQKDGTGIGLAIVKDIVHAYDGELIIGKSKLGGAKFSMILKHHDSK